MATATLQSAVRLPTPEPGEENHEIRYVADSVPQQSPAKRKRRLSRSPSSNKRPNHDREPDAREKQLAERFRKREEAQNAKPLTQEEKQQKAKEEYQRLLNARSGGTYIPPARLRELQAQVTDKSSKEYQRMAWEALKKSINGLINKVNVSNIKYIVPELFNENLIRGRGLFCRSIMKAQSVSLPFTPIFAAMAAIVNTKLPQVGELLVHRLIVQFRKAFKRNDKKVCVSSTTFIAHLVNQQVVHEVLVANMLVLMLQQHTNESVEIAVDLTREVGAHLEEMNRTIATLIFDQFRDILHRGDVNKRTSYMVEVLFQTRKDKYKDNPAVKDELDLVEEEDQITHQPPELDESIDTMDGLNIFKFDPEYEEHEEAYRTLKAEILGEGSDEEEDDEDMSSGDEEEDEVEKQLEIKDQTNTDLTNLRRTIYLTINSSADFEECCHKLMKINLPIGRESELPSMVIETCSQRPTYEKFYGLIGERFARLNRLWTEQFEEQFIKYYETIHRYENNRLRNIARFFGHILGTDAIGWHVFSVVHINEEETHPSSRIFLKILFQDLVEEMGMKKFTERFKDPALQTSFTGLFPTDHPRNTRFSINYFTSIGLGSVTEGMREYLNNLPPPAPLQPIGGARKDDDSASESASSYSSYTSGSVSRSCSRSRSRRQSYSRSRSPVRRNGSRHESPARQSRRKGRGRSVSRSESMSRSPSRSPPARKGETSKRSSRRARSYSASSSRSPSPSRSPPPRRNDESEARSRPGRPNRSRDRYRSRSRSPPRKAAANGVRRRSPSPASSRPRSRSPARRTGGSSKPGDRGREQGRGPRAGGRRGSSVSLSRSRSPPRPSKSTRNARITREEPTKAAPKPARERSLSPYSKRVQLTRQQQGASR